MRVSLIKSRVQNEVCPLIEHVNGVAVCRDVHDSSWESTFFATQDQQEDEEVSEDEGEDEQENSADNEPLMKAFMEVNDLLYRGHTALLGTHEGSNSYRVYSRQCPVFSLQPPGRPPSIPGSAMQTSDHYFH